MVVRAVLPAALICAEARMTSCLPVSLPAIYLPMALIAADSLAPGLHFMSDREVTNEGTRE